MKFTKLFVNKNKKIWDELMGQKECGHIVLMNITTLKECVLKCIQKAAPRVNISQE